MIQTNEYRLKTTYELTSLFQASGHVAVFRLTRGWHAQPVVSWGLAVITETSLERPAGTRDEWRDDGSDPCIYKQVLPLVVGEDSTLEPAAACRGFLGVCRADEDPAVLFEDEIGSDETIREGCMCPAYGVTA